MLVLQQQRWDKWSLVLEWGKPERGPVSTRLRPFGDVKSAEGTGGEMVSGDSRVYEVDGVWGEAREGASFETDWLSL